MHSALRFLHPHPYGGGGNPCHMAPVIPALVTHVCSLPRRPRSWQRR